MSKNQLFIDVPMLKERTAIHDNIDEKLIYPEIKAAQDIYILPLLGTALFNKIREAMASDSLDGDYKKLVDDYLIDVLCNYVIAELPMGLTYQFWNKGVVTKKDDNTNTPTLTELYDISNKYRRRAEEYAQRARLYIRQNAAEKFPEFLNPGQGVDTVVPERQGFFSPIYLGDVSPYGRDEYKTYESKYQGDLPPRI